MALSAQTNTTIHDIAETVLSYDSFALCGHVSPDGDCIGSQLALAHALVSLGKQVACLLVRDEPISKELLFMPGSNWFVPAANYEETPDVFIGVDVPTRERIGEDAAEVLDRCAKSITIDHHAVDSTMCDMVYVDPESASASLLVWQLVKELCPKPPEESALCVYTGLFTDTGGFRYQNSNADAFHAAAELISYGVDAAHVATKVFQTRTAASLKLESCVLERMKVFANGQAVISYVTADDMQRLDAVKSDAEPLIDAIRQLEGTRIACMLREQGDIIRGSLRAKDSTDVSELARRFGGGGHRAAAGFTLQRPIEDALLTMVDAIEQLLISEKGN